LNWKRITVPPSDVPVAYRPLHKYLADRFADVVVLRFTEIEDLLGFALPHSASVQPDWWAIGDRANPSTSPSRAWTEADRTATPNLLARTVAFERAS
jgi:hypothetical protein